MLTTVPEVTTIVRNICDIHNQLESMCNFEEITLIWYDSNLNVNNTKDKLKEKKRHLRAINNFVMFYDDKQKCIDTIKSIKDEKILLITSGSDFDDLLSYDDKLVYRSVQSIFIFCFDKQKYSNLKARYPKIVGIYNNSDELKISIRNEVELIKAHCETFNFYNKNEQKSIRDLSKKSAAFLWLLLFKDIIVQMPRDEKAKNDMVKMCEEYYHGNKNELNRIKEFNQTYKADYAIRWYTRPSFVCALVNKALRIEDVDQLYIFRLFIGDLCREIDKRWKECEDTRSLILYRGVRLPLEEVDKLKINVGQLISTNGFLSTSQSKEVAMQFANKRTEKNTEESVLFEIKCDRSTAQFTNIEKESACPKEKEILFNLGTIFEVLSVTNTQTTETNTNIWIVNMKSTREGTEIANMYIKENWKSLVRQSYVEIFWGHLLFDMGYIEKALQYFKKLIDSRPSNLPVQYIYFEMGRVLNAQGNYDEALAYAKRFKKEMMKREHYIHSAAYILEGTIYQQNGKYDLALKEFMTSLELRKERIWENDDDDVARIHASIGETYLRKGEYQLALNHFNESKTIGEKHFPSNHDFFADYYLHVGIIYDERGDFKNALQHFQKADDIYKKIYPEGNPRLLYHIGSTLGSQGQYEESLKYHHQAIEVEKQLCSTMPHTTAVSLSAIGRIYRLKGEFNKALDYFEKALQIRLQKLNRNHPDTAVNYCLKATALEMLNRYDDALVAYQEALNIQERIYPDGHRLMAVSLASIGNQYRRKKNFELAKESSMKALEMQKRVLQSDHFDISRTLSIIGFILSDQQDYENSLEYLWQALKIQNKHSERESVKCQISTLKVIGDVNKKLGKFVEARRFLEKALSIGTSLSLEDQDILELSNQIQEELKNLKT